MTVVEALQSVQFVVDNQGKRQAILLNIQAWETLIKWIEDVTDSKIALQALSELQEAGGRPRQAGWLDWNDIREEWGDEEEVETEAAPL
jgi:hypothetical protein